MKRWLLAFCMAGLSLLVQAEVAVPALTGRVVDLTGVLDVAARQDLEARLSAIEQQKGSQAAILLLPTTQPEDLAAFGIRVADAWKLGRQGVDDGIIILVALQDRQLRIEVGRGLEGAIPDAIAKRIISDDIAPYFKRGDFHGGLAAGVARIAERVGAEGLPPPKSSSQRSKVQDIGSVGFIVLIILFFVLSRVLGGSGRAYSAGRRGVRTVILPGGFGGGSSWGGRSGGGWSGGGGGFGGGGASGGW